MGEQAVDINTKVKNLKVHLQYPCEEKTQTQNETSLAVVPGRFFVKKVLILFVLALKMNLFRFFFLHLYLISTQKD